MPKEFGNGSFTLKTYKKFPIHIKLRLRKLKRQQSLLILDDLCLRKTRSCSTLKWKPAFTYSSGLERVFEKFCFSWRISLDSRPNCRSKAALFLWHSVDATDYRNCKAGLLKWLVLFLGIQLISYTDSIQQKDSQIYWTIIFFLSSLFFNCYLSCPDRGQGFVVTLSSDIQVFSGTWSIT